MKWTYDWLQDYLQTDAAPEQIADALTSLGLEVEDVETLPRPIVARIVTATDIPGTHLRKLTVDDGTGELRNVVCGAPNARAGLTSVLAVPGCVIGTMTIKSGQIRGHESNGMMCSEKELGISDNHEGIMELDTGAKIGEPYGDEQIVFDAGITPNRPDYLAVRGIARDLSAAGIGKLKSTNHEPRTTNHDTRSVIIKNTAACPTYRFAEIRNIKMAPSNVTISGRLAAIGITPRNACIDATNYVCFDMCQPMHCFDADEISGDIIVRNAISGEKFTDLFGAEHTLTADDLVITDADGILALAGVIGGARGMTTDKTTNILLESAYFDPVTVRKTSKRIGVSTDASYRYERGIDPNSTASALAFAADIIMAGCGGELIGGGAAGRMEFVPAAIKYNPEIFAKKTGIEMSDDAQKSILERLGFVVDNDWNVTPTSARVDVVIAENIVAELMRVYGYDKIKSKDASRGDAAPMIDSVRGTLGTRGLTEGVSFGFGNAESEKILSDAPNVMVKNPIASDMNTARNSLVQNMLLRIAENDRYKRSNINVYELGTVFDGDMPGQQHEQLVIARTGIFGDSIGAKHGTDVTIYDVRADLLALIPDGTIENDDTPPRYANPYRAGRVIRDGRVVARFAELHPGIAKKFGIKTNVVIGIIEDISILTTTNHESRITNHGTKCNDFPDFPLITRDFAFIVDNTVSTDDMVASLRDMVMEINVFDIFDLENGKKSVAFEVVIQPDKNMTDTDLSDLQTKIINHIESNFDAKIRDK